MMMETAIVKRVTVPGIGEMEVSRDKPLPLEFRGLLSSADERQKFWLDLAAWPRDAMGMVFLARALLRLGEAMFPDDWTGYEPSVNTSLKPLPMFPHQCPAVERYTALKTIMPPNQNELVSLVGKPIPQSLWDEATSQRRNTLAALGGPRARLAAVQARLVEAFLDEGSPLPFVVRIDETGDFSETLPRAWWNTETAGARFYWCRMSTTKPITASVGGAGFRWLFVPAAPLAKLVEASRPKATAAKDVPINVSKDRKALEKYLHEIVSASPHKRTHEAERDIWPWIREHAPSIQRRKYAEIRKDVLSRYPGHKWGKTDY